MTPYQITEDTLPDCVEIVAVAGYLDFDATPQFKERLSARIAAGKTQIILDFTETAFIDSTAIGVIVGVVKRLQACAGTLAVVSSRAEFRNLFEVIGLDEVIQLHYSREHALTALSVTA